MTLISPDRLWLLALVALLGVAYVGRPAGRTAPAVRHPDVALVDSIAPRWTGWRRHLTAAACCSRWPRSSSAWPARPRRARASARRRWSCSPSTSPSR